MVFLKCQHGLSAAFFAKRIAQIVHWGYGGLTEPGVPAQILEDTLQSADYSRNFASTVFGKVFGGSVLRI